MATTTANFPERAIGTLLRTIPTRFDKSADFCSLWDGHTQTGVVINDERRGSVCGRYSGASALVGKVK
jgi:hypothetical protein